MTLLSNYNGMRAPKLRCKNYVALAHWAAPAYQAGRVPERKCLARFEQAGLVGRRGRIGRPIYESAAAVKHFFLLVFCFWRPSGRLLSEITIHYS